MEHSEENLFYFQNRYNDLIISLEESVEFSICDKALLKKTEWQSLIKNSKKIKHGFGELSKILKTNYVACVKIENKHICQFFPVMIGSTLDVKLSTQKWKKYTAHQGLCGKFIINGFAVIFPLLLTNRKEFGHRHKDQLILYAYDNNNNGHKFSMDKNEQIVYRDERGIDCFVKSKQFENNDKGFLVDYHHLDLKKMKVAFNVLKKLHVNIDSLCNKMILSPVNILTQAIKMAKSKPIEVVQYLNQGLLEKFDSLKLSYDSGTPSKQVFSKKNFAYRYVQPSHFQREYFDHVVLRLIATNVKQSVIEDLAGYMCILEKSISAGSFNKVMSLLPGIKISDQLNFYKNDINSILRKLCRKDYIKEINYNEDDVNNCTILLVNGGLMTKYKVQKSFSEVFSFIKKINGYMEVLKANGCIIINQVNGLPFRLMQDTKKGEEFLISPLEYQLYFKDFVKIESLSLFGPNCCDELKETMGYLNVTKALAAINYFKNRYGPVKYIDLYDYTSENACVYIDDEKYDNTTEMIAGDLLLSSHHQLSGDGYIKDTNFDINAQIILRGRFEFEINSDTSIEVFEINSDSMIKDYNENGVEIRKYICVLKLSSHKEIPPFKMFQQNKFFEKKSRDNKTVRIYKIIDELAATSDNVEYKTNAILKSGKTNKVKKLYYDLATLIKIKNYNGLKFSDQCSQKGLIINQSTKHFEKYAKVRPSIVASLSTVITRSAIPQLKLLYGKRKYANENILYGDYNFAILRNISSTMKNYSMSNNDLYSNKILQTNGVNHALYELQQQSYNNADKGTFLPPSNHKALNIYNVLGIGVKFCDRNGNVHDEVDINQDIKKRLEEISFNENKKRKLNDHV